MDDLEIEANEGGIGVNFIPCITWVRRGVAKANPEQVKLTKEDLAKIIDETTSGINEMEVEEEDESETEQEQEQEQQEDQNGLKQEIKQEEDVDIKEEQISEEDEEEEEKKEGKTEGVDVGQNDDDEDEDDIDKKYGLDNYDDDDENNDGPGGKLNFGNLISPDEALNATGGGDNEFDDNSDDEDLQIKPTDNLILVGHVEGDASILEVYVYNDVEGDLYVHHDILLPSFPLALEWLSYEPGEKVKGNLVAVGSMSPKIDIWDLDMVNSLEPVFSLGSDNKKKKKKKMSKAKRDRLAAKKGAEADEDQDGHTDAVLSLAWNQHYEHILASGSVDQTVLLWDLEQGKVSRRLNQHKEKVQSLQWHPFESKTLLTGCCDHMVRVFDCGGDEGAHRSWKAEGEVERVLWNHFDPFTFFCSTDNGHVQLFDVRQESKPVWTLSAHPPGEGANGMSLSSQCPGCLVTVSSDQTLKVWDVLGGKPECVLEKSMGMGKLHSLAACPDAPFVVCAGGDLPRDNLRVWDVRESTQVRARYGDRKLVNPLSTSDFGHETLNAAEGAIEHDVAEMDQQQDEDSAAAPVSGAHVNGGAAGKFRKKDKKKGNKNQNRKQ